MRLALTALLLVPALASAAPCPSRGAWPTAGFKSRADQAAASRAREIAALEEYAFTLVGNDAERKGVRTDGLVIVQGGELVYERYARGFTVDKPHLVWSVSKSFTNALTGIAVQRGVLAIDESVCTYLPNAPKRHCDITVKDFLEFASGLDFHETYEGKSNQDSSVLAMLYGQGRKDVAAFVLEHDKRAPPGETYMYSSGDANVLAACARKALEPVAGRDFPHTLLFEPIGMTTATMERDASGTPVGSSWVYATPRDLAKFGFLLLNDGCWDGKRILPEGWVEASTAVSAPIRKKRLDADPGDVQGRQFWLNKPIPEQDQDTPWPDVPGDAFAARGHWGQSITVVPSLDMVIVRVGDDRESHVLDFNQLLSLAIAVGKP